LLGSKTKLPCTIPLERLGLTTPVVIDWDPRLKAFSEVRVLQENGIAICWFEREAAGQSFNDRGDIPEGVYANKASKRPVQL
jgi:hypothetical protein